MVGSSSSTAVRRSRSLTWLYRAPEQLFAELVARQMIDQLQATQHPGDALCDLRPVSPLVGLIEPNHDVLTRIRLGANSEPLREQTAQMNGLVVLERHLALRPADPHARRSLLGRNVT
ncbi:hypothetical protein [Pseudonocardia sp. N23]|uniref:hypothetical protein n=1 Tax=Pseudonocardia sp. N23 TaxID=1987376 RepID=UPI001558C80B|nr:hypothetical protein [Pseudonocardia sp. N23]